MIDSKFLEILACPKCYGDVEQPTEDALVCVECGYSYPVENGIPIMLIDKATPTLKEEDLEQQKKEEN